MFRLVLMGPPGVGKGTQAARLSQQFSIPAISTGDLFRDHIHRQTLLGKEVATTLASGALVSDEMVLGVLAERLTRGQVASGFILDGFPRTEAQVGQLLTHLDHEGLSIDAVVVLDAPRETTNQRILSRDQGRSDDDPAVAERRRDLFDDQGIRAIDAFRGHGATVIHIDGSLEADTVTESIQSALTSLVPGSA